MRREYCPLSSPEYVCPEAEGAYGIEFKDGVYDADCQELEKLGIRYLTEEDAE